MLMSRRTFLKLKKGVPMGQTQRKKVDRVARYQSLAAGWKKSKFLSSQPFGAREGRKLQLANAFKSSASKTLTKPKKSDVLSTQKKYTTQTEKRRDNMTFKLRVLLDYY